jgi:hypothetical protein
VGFIGAGAVTYGDASEVRRDGDVSSPGLLFGDGGMCQDVDTVGASEVRRDGDVTSPGLLFGDGGISQDVDTVGALSEVPHDGKLLPLAFCLVMAVFLWMGMRTAQLLGMSFMEEFVMMMPLVFLRMGMPTAQLLGMLFTEEFAMMMLP